MTQVIAYEESKLPIISIVSYSHQQKQKNDRNSSLNAVITRQKSGPENKFEKYVFMFKNLEKKLRNSTVSFLFRYFICCGIYNTYQIYIHISIAI